MGQGQNSSNRKLKLKTNSHVKHNHCQGSQHAQPAIFTEFVANLRANKIYTTQLNLGVITLQHLQYFLRQCLIGFTLQANQYVSLCTKVHHYRPFKPSRLKLLTNHSNICRFFITHFNLRATRKIQPQNQTLAVE